MKFLPYTTHEILDYFDQINCLIDVQVIADYLNENSNDYSPFEYEMLTRGLKFYAELFTV